MAKPSDESVSDRSSTAPRAQAWTLIAREESAMESHLPADDAVAPCGDRLATR